MGDERGSRLAEGVAVEEVMEDSRLACEMARGRELEVDILKEKQLPSWTTPR